ncbi:hypothetical protein BDV95DRAFT_593970 [Massariosphaeria phaeospora]|uniref:Uncharacterized protein n=1 Tax=Massariosphaeria phaeospora TaxID=100035 RepID=A0A7C8I7I3_9PLEO|nr:hypothetical protein BDV95DRAFT_593970 [Massariosphaeria phaeospora]
MRKTVVHKAEHKVEHTRGYRRRPRGRRRYQRVRRRLNSSSSTGQQLCGDTADREITWVVFPLRSMCKTHARATQEGPICWFCSIRFFHFASGMRSGPQSFPAASFSLVRARENLGVAVQYSVQQSESHLPASQAGRTYHMIVSTTSTFCERSERETSNALVTADAVSLDGFAHFYLPTLQNYGLANAAISAGIISIS